MAKVSAFKGWRYNHEIIDDLKNVTILVIPTINIKIKAPTIKPP